MTLNKPKKFMKAIINKLTVFVSIILLLSCKDDTLDPFRLKDQTKGSVLALRGDSFDNLNDTGCSNSFFRNKVTGTEVFNMDVEFLSEDPSSLTEIQTFAHFVRLDDKAEPIIEKRVLVTTFPGSVLTSPSGGGNPTGTLSINLSDILSKLSGTIDVEDIQAGELTIESDLILKGGVTVASSSIVNTGLFQSGIFYPAQRLTYCTEDIDDYIPEADLGLRVGTPLKSGAKDTLEITFANEIATPPSVTLDKPIGTISSVIADPKDKTKTKFYVIYVAPAGYTGPVDVTVTGAINGGTTAIAGLVEDDQSFTIQVDNAAPQLAAPISIKNLAETSAGPRIGRDQFVLIEATFQEPLDADNTLELSLSGQGLDDVENVPMTLSADGKSVSYLYIYKDSDNPTDATHGDIDVNITGGSDIAGNDFGGGSTSFLNDVGTPPPPVVTPEALYDFGNYIKWTATTTTTGSNPGGATSGTVYFIAVPQGSTPPAQATKLFKGITVNDGFDTTDVEVSAEGSIAVNEGSSGVVYSSLTANGDFDVYFYFINSTGNVSAITTNPLQITMN
jgi:hypothetical protein